MKLITMFLLALLSISSQLVAAERLLHFDASFETNRQFGHTKYRFEQTSFSDSNLIVLVGSELIFPLDGLSAGLTARIRSEIDKRPDWSVRVRLQMTLNDPSEPFTDRDWESLFGVMTRDFSYTESEVEMSRIRATIEAEKLVAAGRNMELFVIAGLGYDRISQDALGFEGWQVIPDIDSNLVIFPVRSDLLALKYQITYMMPFVGLAPKLSFGQKIAVDLKAAFSPLIVNDKDEHLLRNFVSKANGSGFGLITGATIQYDFDSPPGKKQTFVRLGGEYTYLKADVSATINWYGNDSFDDFIDNNGQLVIVDNTGDVAGGIPHNISSRQYSISLSVGIRF